MKDDGSPSRRIYAWKSGFTLGAGNLDIPVNSKEPLVWLNIANNTTISGGASATTGTDVTVRNNGVGPDLIVHYGDAESFPLLDCSWVRIIGNTANVTFYLSDEYIPIRPRPTWGGSTGVVSITSANAGITIAPSSGAVVVTLNELANGIFYGDTFIGPGTNPVQGDVLFNDGTNWHHYPAAIAGSGISVNLATNGATITNTGATSVSNSDGTLTISPTTGAVVASIALGHANRWTGAQQFDTPRVSGSSTGFTTIASANSSATNYTATLPANTGTIAELNLGQVWTGIQQFNDGKFALVAPTLGGALTVGTSDSASNFTATFPANTGTVAELNLAQTWTAAQKFNQPGSTPTLAIGAISPGTGKIQLGTGYNGNSTFTVNFPAPSSSSDVAAYLGTAQSFTALQTFGNNISFGGATLNVASLTSGQFLKYNGTNWVNAAAPTAPAVSAFNPADPGAVNTQNINTWYNCGIGSTVSITPATTGNFVVSIYCAYFQSASGVAIGLRGSYGTGAAPAKGTTTAGVGTFNAPSTTASNDPAAGGGAGIYYQLVGYISGLSVGTAYWVDLQINAGSASSNQTVKFVYVVIWESG